MIRADETVTIGWCDNGSTDGKFVEGLVDVILTGQKSGVKISSSIRVEGNQIGRQRQVLFDAWDSSIKSDWLLCVDSDIVLTIDVLKKLWESADKENHKVVSGVYFISKHVDKSLAVPLPALFNEVSEYQIEYVHPLPVEELIKCDYAGLGLTLMHKSIIPILKKAYPNQSVFAEQEGLGNEFVSEDVAFFRKLKKSGIQLYAHTGAVVTHVKKFALDYGYYSLYWNSKA